MSPTKNPHWLRIGTLLNGPDAPRLIPQIIDYGFESFELTFWQTTGDIDLLDLAAQVREAIKDRDIIISGLSIFGNALTGHGKNADTLASWQRCIDAAAAFGTDLVTGFTGRLVDQPIEASIPRFAQVFGELGRRAADRGVRLAFENCSMGGTWERGDWNIAHNPTAWTMMFDALPDAPIGLEWEPCHQLVSLIDPIPQLRRWASKIYHVHGKDATVAWDIIREHGVFGREAFAWHRTPGFGDSNWRDIITILRQNGYSGTIDIEGFHDPVYRGDLEWTGQVSGLTYLKECRGGSVLPVPR
jgi:sugar phosphate isomerase/epimerase